jgi:hypothetical protein
MTQSQQEESIFDLKVDVFGLETTVANIFAIFSGIMVLLCILFCAAHYGIKMGFKTVNTLLADQQQLQQQQRPLIQNNIVLIDGDNSNKK